MRAYFKGGFLITLLFLSGYLFAASDVAGNKGLVYFPMKINYSEKDDKGGVVVNVVNRSSSPYLLQGSVRAFDPDTGRADEKTDVLPPFVILPPLERLDGEGRTSLRVRQVGGHLPADRESVSIIAIQSIPAVSKEDEKQMSGKRQLNISLRMNLLLIWRPTGVPEPDMKVVASKLNFRRAGGRLEVNNPTPYFVHFSALKVGDIAASSTDAWVPPDASQNFSFTGPVKGKVTWKVNGDNNEHSVTL